MLTAVSLVATLGACGDDVEIGEVFADMRWQVQCVLGGTSCSREPHVAHDIYSYTGGMDAEGKSVTISCEIRERNSGMMELDLTAQTADYRLQIRNAEFDPGGGEVGGANCSVEIVDVVNRYVGGCGSAPPSLAQPCRLSPIGLSYGEHESGVVGPIVTTALGCLAITSPSNTSLVRDVFAPAIEGQDTQSLAPITVINCPGNPARP